MWEVSQQVSVNDKTILPGDKFREMFEREVDEVFLGREEERPKVEKMITGELPFDEELQGFVIKYQETCSPYDFGGRKK